MFAFLATIHIVIAVLLVLFVLIQDSKGGGMGLMGGGGSSTSLFGATGATNILAKITMGLAIGFGVTCISLTIVSSRSSKSLMEGVVAPATVPVPQETVPTTAEPQNPAQPGK